MKRWLCRFGFHDWYHYRNQVFLQDKVTLNTQLNCFIWSLISLVMAGLCYDSKIFGFATPLLLLVTGGAVLILVVTTYATGIFGEATTRWDGVCLRCERTHLGLSKHELRHREQEQRAADRLARQTEQEQLRKMRARQLRSTFDVKRLEELEQEIQ